MLEHQSASRKIEPLLPAARTERNTPDRREYTGARRFKTRLNDSKVKQARKGVPRWGGKRLGGGLRDLLGSWFYFAT